MTIFWKSSTIFWKNIHSASLEVFLAAVSQRTKNIRLGHGVVQLTINQPHRVATLDLISGGRVELRLGEGAGPAELHPFGVRGRDKWNRWKDAVQAIIPMLTREAESSTGNTMISRHGMWCRSRIRSRIHRCGWRAPKSAQSARRGSGGWERRSSVSSHRKQRRPRYKYCNMYLHQLQLTEYMTNPNVVIVNGFMCAPTEEEALEAVMDLGRCNSQVSGYGKCS